MPGRLLIDAMATYHDLADRVADGWRFRSTRLTEVFDEAAYPARTSQRARSWSA